MNVQTVKFVAGLIESGLFNEEQLNFIIETQSELSSPGGAASAKDTERHGGGLTYGELSPKHQMKHHALHAALTEKKYRAEKDPIAKEKYRTKMVGHKAKLKALIAKHGNLLDL